MKPKNRDRELSEEIESHIAMATRDRIECGESPTEARQAALREFGNVPLVAQTTRELWSWIWLEQLVEDFRFGARILWHSPGLSTTAVILVALVVGGNTTVFSIVRGVLTSPAKGVLGERLVTVKHTEPGRMLSDPYVSFPNYRDYAAQSTTVSSLVGWSDERLTVGIESGSFAYFGALVTTNYFETLGVPMAAGRGFRSDDDRASGGLVAIISDRFWRERLQGAADAVGRPIVVNGHAATIVGVTGPGFSGATLTPGEDLWLPLAAYYQAIGSGDILEKRGQWLVLMAGQLVPGASLADARAEFATMSAQLRLAYPDDLKDARTAVAEYSAAALLPAAEMGPRFLALFSVVTLLTLLIVSANVANLMLGRSVLRQRDTAVRQSLGASRGRIIRMLAAEGIAVSVVAWLAACLFAWWTSQVLIRVLEPRAGLLADIEPDWQVAAYAMVLAMLATIAFTTAPALRTWRQQVLPWLRSGEPGVAQGRSTLSSVLVVLQLAFSVLLLTSAGLAYRSLSLLDSGQPGFKTDHLLLVTVRAGRAGAYVAAEPSPAERDAGFALIERMRERLASLGDFESITYSRRVPGAYFLGTNPVQREGQPQPTAAFIRPVGPDYLRTLGLAPIAGRDLTTADRRGGSRVAVINQHLASELWGGDSPLGRTLLVGDRREPVEVVGVAPNAQFDGPAHDERPRYVFLAEQQTTGNPPMDPTFFVRHRGSLESATAAAGRALAEVDPSVPIVTMTTMNARLESVTVMERMIATLLMAFAVASLLVAALGQYAVAMFNMRRRTKDFGVRMAIGASSSQIQRDVVTEAWRLTWRGLVIGFVLSAGVGIAARKVLFGVTPTDPITYAAVFIVLAAASLAASYVPAWRAGRVNVVDALRQE
jgi:predicted permease